MLRAFMAGVLVVASGCQMGGSLAWRTSASSAEAEALAGRRAAPALEKHFDGVFTDATAGERMKQIGDRLAGGSTEITGDWHFNLLASDKINAFSLPGGLIYITRGLYERIGSNDHLLAAIIAHEMGHVVNKDSLKPNPGCTCEAIDREVAADGCAIHYLAAADYKPYCLIELLRLINDVQPAGWAELRMYHISKQLNDSSDNLDVELTMR